MFEKCIKCSFLLKNQSLSYECTGLTDFELTSECDIRTHPLIEMLTHLKIFFIPNASKWTKYFHTKIEPNIFHSKRTKYYLPRNRQNIFEPIQTKYFQTDLKQIA